MQQLSTSNASSSTTGVNIAFVASVAGGSSALDAAVAELAELGCEVTDVNPKNGRIYFRTCTPSAVRVATSVERISILVERQVELVTETFLEFEGATQAEALQRVTDVLLAVDWSTRLATWSSVTGKQSPSMDPAATFKLSAHRTTRKKGKHILPSNVLTREVGGQLARHFGWSVSCSSPDLEIVLRISCDELLVFIPTWVQRAGGQYLSSAGLHPCVAWAMARTLEIQTGDTVLDPMCGKGVLLCEASANWPDVNYLGCDASAEQLGHARSNVAGAKSKHQIGLHHGDASMPLGLPFRDGCVDRCVRARL